MSPGRLSENTLIQYINILIKPGTIAGALDHHIAMQSLYIIYQALKPELEIKYDTRHAYNLNKNKFNLQL
jgi:hypothetical protein